MGYRMAANLRRGLPQSSTLLINDLNKDACEQCKRELRTYGRVKIASTAKDAASQASTVISIVTASSPHARSVYLDAEKGVINAPPDAKRLMLECTGDGTLAFPTGHPAASPTSLQARIQAAISPMASEDQMIFCGDFPTGLESKIVNNYLACSNMAVLAEALAMGMANGVERKTLLECFRKSNGYSWAVDYSQPIPGLYPGPASSEYEVSFLMPMILKDMDLGIGMAETGGTPTAIGRSC
ncbi:6-phosphogluconate dehydrogenase [Aspergillus pseudoustus]|uniref:6-phosphogluconate dehydrogenase n=1 Tax=Aspergillus pseudoustus TaxID=1810923 RepID=A0ABR4KMH8_9EURO